MSTETIFKNINNYSDLEEFTFNLGINCPENELSDLMELIFRSETCKRLCLKEVLENGIITAEERVFLENLKGDELEDFLKNEVRIVQNTGFDPPRISRIESSRSLQSYILKIPTAVMQIKLRLIKLFLLSLPYKKSYTYSFGNCCKRSLLDLDQTIISLLETNKYVCGFSAKIDVYHSGYYLKTLRSELPLPVWLTNRLTKSDNLSIHQLFPETAGVNCLPFLEECILPFWFSKLIADSQMQGVKVIHYKDRILVLCQGESELKAAFSALRKCLPGFGMDFDYETLEYFRIRNGFSFLGRSYRMHVYSALSEPIYEIFDSFLDYINRIIISPFETLPEKENEINRVIIALNLYYHGLPEDMIKEYHDTLLASRFGVYYKRGFGNIKSEIIETDKDEVEHYRLKKPRCPGLDDLLDLNVYSSEKVHTRRCLAEDEYVCPLCGKKIIKGEPVITLEVYKEEKIVHRVCTENIYQILENLMIYPGVQLIQKQRWKKILDDPKEAEKTRRPPVKASWKYYPLYQYFRGQKKKLIRMKVEDLEEILGFRLKEELRDFNRLKTNKGRMLQLRDSWELAGYSVKPMKRFSGTITFERKEPNLKPVLNHPLMECNITARVQRDINNCIKALINSRRNK